MRKHTKTQTMKKVLFLSFVSILLMSASCSETKKATTTTAFDKENMTDVQKASYALGVNIFENFKGQGLGEINVDILAQAMKDVKAGKDLAVTSEDAMAAIQTYQQAQMKIQSEKAEGESKKFFDENGKKEGVKTTASGLQYEVLRAGTGASPTPTDKVKVHYKGTLLDGSTFDSSYDRNEPTSFGVGQVIPGWTEGLQLMKVGAKYKFYIPAKLGYGARGAGAKIPPNSTLVFEVELLDIEAPEAPKK